jgi:putative membrane protein
MHRPILRTLPLAIALALGSGWAVAQTTAPASNTTAGKADAGKKLSHSDKSFIEDAAKGGMAEVQSGKLAEQKASDPAVKQFADRLVQDHSKANDELAQIAQSKGVKMPDKESWGERHEDSKLQKMSGADFDREFAQHSVKDHEKDIKKFEKAASKLDDPDLKAWAQKQLPVLREHLAMAQKLPGAEGQKSASAGSTAPNTRAAGNTGSKY